MFPRSLPGPFNTIQGMQASDQQLRGCGATREPGNHSCLEPHWKHEGGADRLEGAFRNNSEECSVVVSSNYHSSLVVWWEWGSSCMQQYMIRKYTRRQLRFLRPIVVLCFLQKSHTSIWFILILSIWGRSGFSRGGRLVSRMVPLQMVRGGSWKEMLLDI